MSELPSLPEYSPDGFVNRERELALIREQLDALLERRFVDKRTFIFTGQHGIGKSWFLQHLRYLWQDQRNIKVLYINLETYRYEPSPEAVVVQICAAIGNILLPNTVIPHIGPDAAAGFLISEIRKEILREQVMLVLLDTVYEAPTSLLAVLESYLLGLLAIEQNVLMVLAGRGREYAWTTPELRLHAEFEQIDLFTEIATAQLLRHYMPANFSRANEIYYFSRGNPKTTLLLAANKDLSSALDQVIEEMLPAVDPLARQLMREHLEALAVVRRFDYGHLPYLWSTYYNNPDLEKLPRRELRLILDRLLEPGLIYWNTGQLAYTLHEAMRNMLLHYLYHAKPVLWRKLHQCCAKFYQEWVDAKPRNWEQWQDELNYHQRELEKP